MKPIIFSTPMVQALLNTKPDVWPAEPIDPEKPFKSMTRRVIIPQPTKATRMAFKIFGQPERSKLLPKRHYQVGDLLWVRETWCKIDCPRYEPCDCNKFPYMFRADEHAAPEEMKWNPSIFMPRKAARIFLEVKTVRVERLQDITIEDVQAEGVAMSEPPKIHNTGKPENFDKWPQIQKDYFIRALATHTYISDLNYVETHIYKYAELWDSLNAKRGYSWKSNPWTWVYEFMRRDTDNG